MGGAPRRSSIVRTSILPLGLCAVLAVAAAQVAATERAAVRGAAASISGQVPLGVRSPLPIPYSIKTQTLLAGRCTLSLAPGRLGLLPQPIAEATLAHCADYVARALDRLPQEPQFWILQAAIDLREGNLAAMKQALDRARDGAPMQSWLAERRLMLLSRAFPGETALPHDWQDGAGADIDALLQSQSGAEYLARHYLKSSTLAPLIDSALLRAEPAHQRRMVNLLKAGLSQ